MPAAPHTFSNQSLHGLIPRRIDQISKQAELAAHNRAQYHAEISAPVAGSDGEAVDCSEDFGDFLAWEVVGRRCENAVGVGEAGGDVVSGFGWRHAIAATGLGIHREERLLAGYRLIYTHEHMARQMQSLAESIVTLKVIKIPQADSRQYIGFLELPDEFCLDLQPGDAIKGNFNIEEPESHTDWHACLVDSLPVTPPKAITILLTQPWDKEKREWMRFDDDLESNARARLLAREVACPSGPQNRPNKPLTCEIPRAAAAGSLTPDELEDMDFMANTRTDRSLVVKYPHPLLPPARWFWYRERTDNEDLGVIWCPHHNKFGNDMPSECRLNREFKLILITLGFIRRTVDSRWHEETIIKLPPNRKINVECQIPEQCHKRLNEMDSDISSELDFDPISQPLQTLRSRHTEAGQLWILTSFRTSGPCSPVRWSVAPPDIPLAEERLRSVVPKSAEESSLGLERPLIWGFKDTSPVNYHNDLSRLLQRFGLTRRPCLALINSLSVGQAMLLRTLLLTLMNRTRHSHDYRISAIMNHQSDPTVLTGNYRLSDGVTSTAIIRTYTTMKRLEQAAHSVLKTLQANDCDAKETARRTPAAKSVAAVLVALLPCALAQANTSYVDYNVEANPNLIPQILAKIDLSFPDCENGPLSKTLVCDTSARPHESYRPDFHVHLEDNRKSLGNGPALAKKITTETAVKRANRYALERISNVKRALQRNTTHDLYLVYTDVPKQTHSQLTEETSPVTKASRFSYNNSGTLIIKVMPNPEHDVAARSFDPLITTALNSMGV
ncbi:hypothetical protein CNMCM5793_004110 [Aspergillus hiratsukae]|uniref:Uncharacterized protein n=1 Tax=Aspergillus hiratsukae TaxID=1194566 RepID=A0A8H6PEY7_9EURO|nr:hypothetical protein CNMCM5793_004110 [Aspergillus hiratsukae]KAF7169405.1 hypothetical protein CNMCM6106_004330 [Aspergillus hiratsukae]